MSFEHIHLKRLENALRILSKNVNTYYTACLEPEEHDDYLVWVGGHEGCSICVRCLVDIYTNPLLYENEDDINGTD